MLKVIIVDDEEITRSGLIECIDWNKLGVEVAGEASDGVEALELVGSVHPDFMLCDVRMPRMDGIVLACKVTQQFPECKIIFLSGYSDVEYLKSAIRIKAVDYVEKPVDLDELESLISRTVLLCLEEKEKKRAEQDMLLKVGKSIPYVRSRLVEALTGSEDFDLESVNSMLSFIGTGFPTEGDFLCCVMSFSDRNKKDSLLELVYDAIGEYGFKHISAALNQEIVTVFSLNGSTDLRKIYECCTRLVTASIDSLKVSVTLGMGSIQHGADKIRNSFQSAIEALKYQFYRGRDTVISYYDIRKSGTPTYVFDRNQHELLEEYLKKEDMDGAEAVISMIIGDLEKNNNAAPDHVRKALFNIYLLMSKICAENIFEIENDSDVLWAKIFLTGELSLIRKFLMNKLQLIKDRNTLLRSSKIKSTVKEIEDYISQNYNQEISISTISREVYLAPTYLCLLFKKEKGETINEYITRLRIEKAKELLRDRKVKLYEVASRVGYNDTSYFTKVFKKTTGYNPSDYRDCL